MALGPFGYLLGIACFGYVSAFNITNILIHYVHVCGFENLCNSSILDDVLGYKPARNYSNRNICPKCYCERTCFHNANCCPDYFFSQPMQKCVNFQILDKNPNNNTQYSFYAVDSCKNQTLGNLCQGSDNYTLLEKLQNIPVVSLVTGITYRNKDCAMCNNENYFNEVGVAYKCVTFTDFNYFSSVDEIFNTLENNLCEIRYKFDWSLKNCHPRNGEISQCPENSVSDVDIIEACHSAYTLKHRVYKNVFCFMCNQPNDSISETVLFDKCNITGLWKPFDSGIQASCRHGITTLATKPYKNIFCFLCNRDNSQNSTHSDADIEVVEMLNRENLSSIYMYKYYIIFESLSIPTYLDRLGDLNLTVYTGNREIRIPNSNEFVNISYLIDKYRDVSTRKDNYCYNQSEKSLHFSQCSSQCFCEEETLFSTDQNTKPCIDVAMSYPAKCQSYTIFSNPQLLESGFKRRSFLSTYGCFNSETSATIKSRCKTERYSDIFSVLPVTDMTSGITYKNLDCYSCNNRLSALNFCSKPKLKLFNMVFSCSQPLNFPYTMNVYDIFRNARKRRCHIEVVPKAAYMVKNCKTLKNVIRTCNESGTWKTLDKQVLWACEQLDDLIIPKTPCYKNHFCKMCNENSSFVCNTTSVDDDDDVHTGGTEYTSGGDTLTFHNIFSLQLFNSDEGEITGEDLCNNHQIFDTYKSNCRNVTCFPGKIVVNGTCVPLLKTTSDLRYTIVTGLTGNVKAANIEKILSLLEYHIPREMKYETGVRDLIIESVSMVTNIASDNVANRTTDGEFQLQILLHMTVHIPVTNDRMKLEQFLVSFTTNYSITLNEVGGVVFTTSFNKDAIFITTYLAAFGTQRNFSLTKSNLSAVSNNNARFTFVNKVLQCLQIILEDTEFMLDKSDMSLTLLRSGSRIDFSRFQLYSDGKARICVDDYLKYSTSKEENILTHVLVIFTLVCLGISMLCLLLTFVTYCLFASLRSLPGKNNMNLIVSIFLVQLSLILSMFLNQYSSLCTIIAISVHYFMLAMFSAMTVCCFHMFRVFSKLRISDSSLDNKNYIYYISFTYGFPLILITSNIVTFLIVTKGQDTGYGGSRCFVKSQVSFIVTFFVPILCVCIANIIFFVITVRSIRQNPNVSSNQTHRLDTLVYMKLFTITGIMWVLQIVESQFDVSWVSFIVTFLNGCQGLFILLSYICNKRVFLLYKGKFTKSRLYSRETLKTDTTRISASPRMNSRL